MPTKLLTALLLALALAACDSSGSSSSSSSTASIDTPGIPEITGFTATDGEAEVNWSKTSGVDANNWSLFQNDVMACEQDLAASTDGNQSGSCSATLEEGDNVFYVRLCNIHSSGDKECSKSELYTHNYQPEDLSDQPPGAITLTELESPTYESELYVSWSKADGINGDQWFIHHDGAQACSGGLTPTSEQGEQSSGCYVDLNIGANSLQAELCITTPTGIDDLCTQSATASVTRDYDPGKILAQPVIDELDASLAAESATTITWSKDTSAGTLGESWTLYQNGSMACSDQLAADATGASCLVDIALGGNDFQVQLCTESETYSTNKCSESAVVSTQGYAVDPVEPGTIDQTSSYLSETYEESLSVRWDIQSGSGVQSWMVLVNEASYCVTEATDTYQTSGECEQVGLELGDNNITVYGCNYGFNGSEACTYSDSKSVKRLALPGQAEITSLPTDSYSDEVTLSWERSSGASAESWLALVNDNVACPQTELSTDEDPQSGSCTIPLTSGHNSVVVRLCVANAQAISYCTDSDSGSVELLAPIPGTAVITTPGQTTGSSSIDLAWERTSGETAATWQLYNDGSEVAACAGALEEAATQQGSCTLPLEVGTNTIWINLCNTNAAGTTSCSSSASVAIEREVGVPNFTSATSVSVDENTATSFYIATATDENSDSASLSFFISGGVDQDFFTIDATSGALSFNSADIPDFEVPADSDSDNTYEVDLEVRDELEKSDSLALQVMVTNVDDFAPLFTSSGSVSVSENSDGVVYLATARDDDSTILSFAISGGADSGHFEINSSNGELSPTIALDFENPQDSDQDNSYELELSVTDPAANSGALSLSVTIGNLYDEAPAVPQEPQTVDLSLSSISTGSVIYNVADAVTDADADDQLSYSLGGVDAGHFNLDATTGELSFATLPSVTEALDANGDYIYEIEVSAQDLGANTSSFDLNISVDTTTAPEFSSASASVDFPENSTAEVYTATATDANGDAITYSLGGADAAIFAIDATSGVVSFQSPPDFEIPQAQSGTNTYAVEIIASDGALSSSQSLSVTVTNINDESPELTSVQSVALNFSTISLDTVVHTVTATDPDPEDQLTYTLGGDDQDHFALDPSSGALNFTTLPSLDSPKDADQNNVYDLETIITDSANNSSSFALTITVADDIGSAPVFSSASASVQFAENSTDVVYTAQATDPDGDAITYSLSGADSDLFTIDAANGELSFKTAPDFETPLGSGGNDYSLTILARDLVGNQSQQSLSVSVTNLNDNQPIFTDSSPAPVSVPENTSADTIIYTATATDGDGDALTYSLGVNHSTEGFAIDSSNGALSLSASPDFENPFGNNSDNTYQLEIRVVDADYTTTIDLTVEVTNLNDNFPTFTDSSPLSLSFPENTSATTILYTATATDGDADTITYSLGGADSAHFNLGSATGELSFQQSPDFETPFGDNPDNIYDIEISASDGEASATLELSIEVTDVVDTVPNAPTNFSALAADSSVVLSWDSLESISNYTIYQSTSSNLSTSNFEQTYTNIATSPETISDLSNATTYYFLITASNVKGESAPSAVVSATPQAYTLACPYPSATASKADTSALDCACTGSSANAMLALTSEVTFSCADSQRNIVGNSVPDHAPGVFPNDGNPNTIAAVTGNYSHSLQPTWYAEDDTSEQIPGVARNGVKLEPETGETYQGDNAWRYEAIQDALDLGLDEHHAHVQPTGMYHYHGMPEGHLDLVGISNAMILVGWARDGYPIYARYGYSDPLDSTSAIKVVSGSYEHRALDELNELGRPSSDSERGLDSLPLGVFVADWEYVDGSGDLDECNGRYGVTPQFPDGIYHYYITDDYPYIQRCLKGNEAPVFSSASSISVAENTSADNVIYTASASDSGGDSFTFALNSSAHDGALFSIDSDSGELRFLTSPNFEAPADGNGDNRYTVVIEADDGFAGGIAPLELEVTVTDVEEYPPYFANTSDLGSVTEDPETEGQEIAVLALEFDLYDDEDDAAGRALSLELEGEDGSLFAIASTDSANSYQVNFITSPDFDFAHDIDGDSTYNFTVVATDSDANEVSHSATIVVDGINDEAPYFDPAVYDGTAIYIPENDVSVIINLTGAGYDPDRTSWSDPNPYQPNQDSITFALTTHMSQSDSDLFYLDPDTLELSPKEPFDFENPQQLNSNDNSYWVEVALSDQAGNKNTIDGSEQGAGDRIVRVTISDIVDESTQPVASGPQIPWFNSSDLAAGADVAIPWVIYAGQGAIEWQMYVNGTEECSYAVSDLNSPVSSGTCVVSASKFTAGTTDNAAAVSVCDIDGNCATSDTVTFGYAVSSASGYYPSAPTSSGDASDCADVDIGEPVDSVNNSSCYNYLLSDDAFGGPYDEIPAYLKADSGRNFDVIAYFIEWGVYARDFDTHDLPANLLSTALFSFIKFDGDRAIPTSNTEATDAERECEDCTFTGEVAIADTWAVFDKPYYKPGEEEKYEDEADDAEDLANILLDKGVSTGKGIFQQLWLLKQKFPHLKTCVSVGGWSFSRPFPLLRTQEGMLETFVDSIVDLAQQYHFDCIDIDWEFPGKAGGDYVNNDAEIVYDLNGNGISPFTNPTDEDADTFNELIAALRAEIDQRGAAIEINSAVYTSTDGMAIMDYSNFPVNLEGIHMMTYDYYGAWDPFTGMQAALYASTDPVDDQVILEQGFNPYNPDHNIASAMTRGVNNAMAHGFQSNVQIRQKIVPGLAFYGRNYSGVGASHGGQDPSSKRFMVSAYRDGNDETAQFGWEAGNLNYVQIKGYYNHGDTVSGNADYIAVDDYGNEYSTADVNWTYYWSEEAQTPFLFAESPYVTSGSFVSYTDPRAIYYQTCHAAWQNSKGVMFWEVSGDSEDFHLVNAIHAAVRGDDLVHDNYTNNPSCTDLDQIDHGDIVYGEAAGGGDGDGDGDGDGGDGDGGNGGSSSEGLAGLVELGYIDESTFNSMFPHRNNDPSSTAQGVDTYTWDGFSKAAAEFTAAGFLNVGSTDDRLRELAAFLANTSHETGNSTGSYALSNIGGGIGNTRYDAGYYFQQEQYCAAGGSGYGYTACDYCELGFGYDYACDWLYADGNKFDYYYYGRGPLQLSYNYNYGPFSEYYYNGDADVLLYDANKMLEDSEVAFASALWFWMTVQSPKPSMHQVMVGTYEPSLEDQSLGRYPGFGMSINVLNGGVECGATPSAGTAAYDKIRNRLGYYLTYLNLFSAKQDNVGISPWVGEYALSTPATSLDFPTDDESLLVTYPDANKYLGCSEMYNYQ